MRVDYVAGYICQALTSSFIHSSNSSSVSAPGRAATSPVLIAFCSSFPPKSDKVTKLAMSKWRVMAARGSRITTDDASRKTAGKPPLI